MAWLFEVKECIKILSVSFLWTDSSGMMCGQQNELELEGEKSSHNQCTWPYMAFPAPLPGPRDRGTGTGNMLRVRTVYAKHLGQDYKEALEASMTVEHPLSTRHWPRDLNSSSSSLPGFTRVGCCLWALPTFTLWMTYHKKWQWLNSPNSIWGKGNTIRFNRQREKSFLTEFTSFRKLRC